MAHRADCSRALAAGGSAYASLGLAPLSRRALSNGSPNPVWMEAGIRLARAHGRRFYNFDGLDAFKSKFQTARWDPVYATARASRFSPGMLYAVAAAFTRGSPVLALARGIARAALTEARWLAGAARSR